MNKLILFIMLLATIGCSDRKDGIYQANNGWDIVENGKTYQYRCETDGLYLYIDWDGANSYIIGFRVSRCKDKRKIPKFQTIRDFYLCSSH